MKPLWFIEQPKRVDQESIPQRLSYLVEELGCEVISHPYIPFKQDYDFSFLPIDRPVIFYGSINMVKLFQLSSFRDKVKPFCWFDFEEMSCRTYYTHWGKHLLQSNYAFYTFGEILRLKQDIYSKFAKNDLIFIRPDTNDKAFTGTVVHKEKFNAWFENQQDCGVGLLQLCVISSPEDINAEYRLVIKKKSVVTSSLYRLDGFLEKKQGCPEEIKEFAELVTKTVPWQPAPIYCMDVAMTKLGPRLIEIGEINCAGFYEMDLFVIAKAMIEVAENSYISI